MKNNYAFIDSQNLHLSVVGQGWKIDWKKFRKYLLEKYEVQKAYLFIGMVSGNSRLYKELQEAGFICIWKPTLTYRNGTIKGNVDTELVLQAMIEKNNFDKAVIVSGDGDFFCLVDYFINEEKLLAILIPNEREYSALLKIEKFHKFRRFVNDLKNKIMLQK